MFIKPVDVLSSKTIACQPGRYIGWPTIGRMPDGELLAVFSGDRDAHVDPFGKTFLIRSIDNGGTWSSPVLVNDTPLDDRDAGLCICPEGTVIISWFTSHYTDERYLAMCRNEEQRERRRTHLRNIEPGHIRQWAGEALENSRYQLGHWIRRSRDAGHTWEDPVRVPPTAPHGPIALADGRLLFVGIETNHGRHRRDGNLLVAESSDQGDHWRTIRRLPMYPEYGGEDPDGFAYFCEPHLTQTASGKLVAMARYEEIPRGEPRSFLWQFESVDGGHTWTEAHRLPILGKPPHLITLKDGRLLVSYGYRHEPYGQRACLSSDEGKTWDLENEIILRADAPSGDLGYPASVQLGDGSILTVYYQQEKASEQTCLMTTRWTLPD